MRNIELDCVNPLNGCKPLNIEGVSFLNYVGDSFIVSVPDKCPICQSAFDMSHPNQSYYDEVDRCEHFNIFSIYMCPCCRNGFVLKHHMLRDKGPLNMVRCMEISYPSAFPAEFENVNVDEQIYMISPRFYEIYKQCLAAKNNGYTELYGMGFRKALETLVKDYAIHIHPEDKEWITTNRSATLHECIKKYFKNSDAKTALMACKWLGNDETHYENHNTVEDLQLFEDLIEDVLYYIHRESRGEKAKSINDSHDSSKNNQKS